MSQPNRRSTTQSAAITAVLVWGVIFVVLVIASDWNLYLDWLIAGTVTTFLFYAYDKMQAKRNGWRIPEVVLQGLVLAGGVIGGWLGMLLLRHKTLHRSFWVVQWVATVIYLVLAWVFWLR